MGTDQYRALYTNGQWEEMVIFSFICIALLLDHILGEPRRYHPLIGFGNLAIHLEKRLNRFRSETEFSDTGLSNNKLLTRSKGALAVLSLTALPAWLTYLLLDSLSFGNRLPDNLGIEAFLSAIIQVFGLYLCIGRRSLMEHARAIGTPLSCSNLASARAKVAMIVSRDTQQMSSNEITRATAESVFENANDACFASLFWFAVGGLPAVLLHRLSNTLDAMWGYKTERYLHFGWAAAKLDDLLNWIPARLGALGLAIVGQTRIALNCWRTQAKHYESPNGGVIMAAGAGALNIKLGGNATYHGTVKRRPTLGTGRDAEPSDIERSISLVNQTVALWLILLFFIVLVA